MLELAASEATGRSATCAAAARGLLVDRTDGKLFRVERAGGEAHVGE
jgi:hypothetical protein